MDTNCKTTTSVIENKTYKNYFTNKFPIGTKPTHVLGFVIDSKSQLLMVSRDRVEWEIPGGKLEENESARHALTREIYEESAIQIKQDSIKPFFYTKVTKLTKNEEKVNYQFRYICEVKSIDNFISDPDEDIVAIKFVNIENFIDEFKWRDSVYEIHEYFVNLLKNYN